MELNYSIIISETRCSEVKYETVSRGLYRPPSRFLGESVPATLIGDISLLRCPLSELVITGIHSAANFVLTFTANRLKVSGPRASLTLSDVLYCRFSGQV